MIQYVCKQSDECVQIGLAVDFECFLFDYFLPTYILLTSLEQLNLAEFSGKKARPKGYKNGLKKFIHL